MVIYFSGTGNSQFAAYALASKMNDSVISLNDIMKRRKVPRFHSESPYVVVAPIYAWRYPKTVEELLRKAVFTGNKRIYFLATMESQTGNCDRYCEKLCRDMKMEFGGFCGVRMPNNYVSGGPVSGKEDTREILARALPLYRELAGKIVREERIRKQDRTLAGGILSGPVNACFNLFMVTSGNYVVSDACNSCGKCVTFCPRNNIVMNSGHPEFGNRCMGCYGCINRCPQRAIDIEGKTEKNGRYVCPEFAGFSKEHGL